MSYYEFYSYQSVGMLKDKADKAIEKLRKKNPDIEPVIIEGRVLAKSWWGKAWNHNLESYADYRNRIARGRRYVRNHAVMDLKISKGCVSGLVQGSGNKPYKIQILIDTLPQKKWDRVTGLCHNQIASLDKLIDGKFPMELQELFTDKKYGLFPSPKEIKFDCSCPDWASMCKHVAAILYGIGSRLDSDPMLFFELRNVDGRALVRKSIDAKIESMLKNASKKSGREIDEKNVYDLFGL